MCYSFRNNAWGYQLVFDNSDTLCIVFVTLQRLVDLLEEKKVHLPSILQSLGCIAQITMPIFETREEEITNFITKKILECNDVRLASFEFSNPFPFYTIVITIPNVSRI
jgi:hypothetical protein